MKNISICTSDFYGGEIAPSIAGNDERPAHGSVRHLMADVSRFFSDAAPQHDAMDDERRRLARDLHDGLLQTLTAVMLQINAASKELTTAPKAAQARLRAITNLIAAEQRDLRALVQGLNPPTSTPAASSAQLTATLKNLCRRARLGGVRVEFVSSGDGPISRDLANEIYRIVHESIANITRHAHAQTARVELSIQVDRVHITISDDGCGFPFRGKFDLAALNARNCGPASLRARVAALRGSLVLTSSPAGSCKEIALPLEPSVPGGVLERRRADRPFNARNK